jgi:hypothetical protein
MILNDTLPLKKGIWGSLRSQTKVTTLVFFGRSFAKILKSMEPLVCH